MLSVRINVLCPAELVSVQPNLKPCQVILLTEVGMYASGEANHRGRVFQEN